jgi:hypothetical protein
MALKDIVWLGSYNTATVDAYWDGFYISHYYQLI